MADRRSEYSFLQVIHIRIDNEIDIFISIRPMTTKFRKQIHLEELTQLKLIKQVTSRSGSRNKLKTLYLHY